MPSDLAKKNEAAKARQQVKKHEEVEQLEEDGAVPNGEISGGGLIKSIEYAFDGVEWIYRVTGSEHTAMILQHSHIY